MIGDVILFYLAPNKFNLVGRIPALNWVTFHAQTGKYDVKVELDQRSALRTTASGRAIVSSSGPNAMKIIEKAIGKTPPELVPFNRTTLTIGGKTVNALRHGMAGPCGLGAVRTLGKSTRPCTRRWSKRAKISACVCSARALTPPIRWSRG